MDIPQFYSGVNIFITSATGFVGICLIEKLLRCTPGIGSIYVLIRPRTKQPTYIELKTLLNDPIFKTLKAQTGVTQLEKIIGIAGDINKDGLGLSAIDRATLIQNTNIVIHCPPSLHCNESLRSAIMTNLLGTRRVVEFCKKMSDLKVLTHVSTAYANADRRYAKEIIYPNSNTPDKIIDLIHNLDDNTIKRVLPVILERSPNPHTFTKNLAEHEVLSAHEDFPTVIIRPSMITGAWKEPVPGWTNSKHGLQGFLTGVTKGIIRRFPINKHLIYDYIPIDVVINEIIASSWHAVQTKPSSTLIFHCTTSTSNPFRWNDLEKCIPKLLNTYPIHKSMWYPTLKFIPSMRFFRLSATIFHLIPAYFSDALLWLCGHKPVLVKIQKNITKTVEMLEPFLFTEWKFDNTNTLALQQALTPEDQKVFGVDTQELVWEHYFTNLTLGIRQYLHKENIYNLSAAKIKNFILWLMNIGLQVIVLQVLLTFVCICFRTTLLMSLWCCPIFLIILYFL